MSDFHSFATEYGAADKLFQAVLSCDKARVEQLKAQGVTLTENVKQTFINGGGTMMSNKPSTPFWYLYLSDLMGIGANDFIYISQTIYEEIGEPLYYSESLADSISEYHYKHEVFICLMECYNHKKFNKKKIMQKIVRKDRIDLLKICIDAGWLAQPKKRDELIQYAVDNNKTECTAWLMDFKNRTADFAAEREKAEKKMRRELNADPNSVTELKKIWSYRKQDDGTLIITNYKGNKTEITVPEKIGKDYVTALAEGALSKDGPRKTTEVSDVLEKVTKITLPDTIKFIGKSAFWYDINLQEVNIPDGVDEIGALTFCNCRSIKSIQLPESVKKIGESAFSQCDELEKISLPQGIPEIADYTFDGCESLETVKIPDSVKKIGRYAFIDCENLRKIVIPNGVEEIGVMAFWRCKNLETVVIPPSVQKIKNGIRTGEPITIFDSSPNVTAIVEPESYAEEYCKKTGIPYMYKEAE